jgi:hypothetical protein
MKLLRKLFNLFYSTAKKTYPDKWLRGIPNSDFIGSNHQLRASAFQFAPEVRHDGFCECSISWNDDTKALDLLMDQKKQKGDEVVHQFKIGVAILSRSELDRIITNHNCKDAMKYERARLPENPYHGNLLCNSILRRDVKDQLIMAIALLCVKEIKYRETENNPTTYIEKNQ